MKYDRSEIMKRAWMAARKCAKMCGGKACIYFSRCLKASWDYFKKLAKTVVVPNWFIQKNFGYGLGYELRKAIVEKETEKAVYVNAGGEYFWCPKSILEK